MAKEDILLRATSNPPLTTKGSALSWAELDANWIEIYNAFVALSQSSYVAAYDNAVEYDDTVNNYVSYSSQIWKFINSTPATNVTPVEGATWTKVYATDLVNRPLPIDGVKRYKCLLSQNAPIATTTDPTMVAGQIWTLEAYNAADAATIAALELISGTLYAVGSKYRSATDQTLNVNAATTFSYDGSPYIVSTDANGDFATFVNTLGEDLIFEYDSTGNYLIKSSGIFVNNKTIVRPIQTTASGVASKSIIVKIVDNNTDIAIYSTNDGSTPADEELYCTLVEIEVYP